MISSGIFIGTWAGLLQWGHNFSVVEIFPRINPTQAMVMLQWGHNFSVVEIWYNSACKLHLCQRASIGPQLFSCGDNGLKYSHQVNLERLLLSIGHVDRFSFIFRNYLFVLRESICLRAPLRNHFITPPLERSGRLLSIQMLSISGMENVHARLLLYT